MHATPPQGISAFAAAKRQANEHTRFETDPAANTFAELGTAQGRRFAQETAAYFGSEASTLGGAGAGPSSTTTVKAAAVAAPSSADDNAATGGGFCDNSQCMAILGSSVVGAALVALLAVGLFVYRRRRQHRLGQQQGRSKDRRRTVEETGNGQVRIATDATSKQQQHSELVQVLSRSSAAVAGHGTSTISRVIPAKSPMRTPTRQDVVKPAPGGNGPGWTIDAFNETTMFEEELSDDDNDDHGHGHGNDATVTTKALPSIPENVATSNAHRTLKETRRPPMIKVPASNFNRTPRPPSFVASYTVPPIDGCDVRPMLSPVTPLLSPPMHLDMGETAAAVFGTSGYVRRSTSMRGGGLAPTNGHDAAQTVPGVGRRSRKLTVPAKHAEDAYQRRSIDGVW